MDKYLYYTSEIERYEQALSNFRGSANVSRKDGLAETEERALKLGEIEKTREIFQKGLLTTITYVDGKKMRDRARESISQFRSVKMFTVLINRISIIKIIECLCNITK